MENGLTFLDMAFGEVGVGSVLVLFNNTLVIHPS